MNSHQNPGAVLITGASTGIGKAAALHLERLGFEVFATLRNERDAQALRSESSGRLTPLIMDVTDAASIDRAREQVSQALGDAGLAGLINNAGVGFVSPLEFAPLDELRRLFEVNLFGALAVTQAFLPLLRQGRGRILNVSSTATLVVAPFHGPYSASKLALNGLSDALRLELKPHGVQVSVIVCGSVQTPIWEKGEQWSGRIADDLPPQAMELYGGRLLKLRDYFARIGRAGLPTEAVSRTIERALTARRAKNTYFVGLDAAIYSIGSRLLPGRLRDWVVLQAVR
jgi:NAD(P)-dependent dehydrogenase (short-subunit alcohol dehydrogenase family)